MLPRGRSSESWPDGHVEPRAREVNLSYLRAAKAA